MANKKFSAFAATGTYDTTTARIAGYTQPGSGSPTQNNIWTADNIAAGLATLTTTPYSIYAGDGTIGTTRKALITDTIQFRNAGDSSDIFKLNTDGTFALGLGASATIPSQIAIGNTATANSTYDICIGTGTASGGNSIAIGRSSSSGADGIAMGNSASCGANGISMGQASSATGTGIALGLSSNAGESGIAIGAMASHVTTAGLHSIAMGGSTRAAGNYSVAIGYNCGSNSTSVNSCVNIGSSAQGDGANSITLSANAAGDVTTSTANAFGVYMSSNTAPDFEVVGGGESTLNTSLKITGQGYTPPHVIVDEVTVDWNDSNIQTRTLVSGSSNFTPSNAKAGATYILKLTQPSSGTATVSWESSAGVVVNWPGGTAPTLSGTGKIDIVTLICTTGGATGGTFYANATLDFS